MGAEVFLQDVRAVHQNLGSWEGRLIDCRGASEYNRGHIPGAINIPNTLIQDPESERGSLLPFAVMRKNLHHAGVNLLSDEPLLLYDDSGLVPSARLFWVLEVLGRNKVQLLDGGFISWLKGKYPITKDPFIPNPIEPQGHGGSDDTNGHCDRLIFATKEDVLATFHDPDGVIVDARSIEEYRGMKITAERNGHIPGAVHLNWEEHIRGLFDPVFKDQNVLKQLYYDQGVTRDKKVIVYCRSGARSSHSYFTLRMLGFTRVSNYSASWLEWGNEPDTPIE